MNFVMWISKIGVQVQDVKLQVIVNNLVNVNIVGFKCDCVMFEDLFYQVECQFGVQVEDGSVLFIGVQLGNGMWFVGMQKVFMIGSLQQIGQDLDFVIVGQGFFQVEGLDGQLVYICVGQLQINVDGKFVNVKGQKLQLEIMIFVNVMGIMISEDGIVFVKFVGSVMFFQLGQLKFVNFVNLMGLFVLGDNFYQEIVVSGVVNEGMVGVDGFGMIKQGVFEGLNVQVVEEMVDMIVVQCIYEMNIKVLFVVDNMLQYLFQVVR